MTILEFANVQKSFANRLNSPFAFLSKGQNVVLRDVDFRLETGEAVGVVGENGAGKTTLLKLAASLIWPTHGVVRIFGVESTRLPPNLCRKVGFAGAGDRTFYGRLSVVDNLEYFGGLAGIRSAALRRQIVRLGKEFDITVHLDRPYRELSSGIRHCASIVRALLHEPELLLLDEPTRSLDAAHRDLIFNSLRRWMRAEGRACLLTTHDTAAAAYVDRTIRIAGGALVANSAWVKADSPAC